MCDDLVRPVSPLIEETDMSDTKDVTGPAEDKGGPEAIEVVIETVSEDGDVIVDDLVAEFDSEGHVIAIDEKTVIQMADGDVVVDETFSVAGEDGTIHAITEDVTVVEADDSQK
jgi:hypothetical protein